MSIVRVLAVLAVFAAVPALAQGPADGAFGNALVVSGTSGYAWAAPNAAGLSEGTIECWVVAPSASNNFQIWGGGNGVPGTNGDWLRLGSHSTSGGLSMGLFAGVWRWGSGGTIGLGYWKHVAGTWGPDGIKTYVNGVLVGEHSYNGGAASYAVELFGTSSWGSVFPGAMDELRVWDHARTGAQIQANMDAPLTAAVYQNPSSGLQAYYPFEQFEDLGVNGDGEDDLRDLSLNGNHADAEGDARLNLGAVQTEATSWSALKGTFGQR